MKKRGHCNKGSLTIFAALSLMLISQFIFIMIEAARYVEIDKITEIQSRSELESIFAEYCKPLWEEYHILGVQLSEEEVLEHIRILADLNSYAEGGKSISRSNMNLFRTSINDISLDSYELLTDGSGAVYEAEISSYMKKNISYEMARKLYDDFSALENMTGKSDYSDNSIDDALDVIENKEDYQVEEKKSNARTTPKAGGDNKVKTGIYKSNKEDDSTLEDVKSIKNKGILTLVLSSKAQKKLSDSKIKTDQLLSKRELNVGRNVSAYDESWMDRILLELYMENYMSSFIKPKSGRPLTYEYEYLLAGKSSDVDNLKSVVNQILAIREAANFVYILSDAGKMSEISALAAAIGGATLNPLGIALIEAGLMASWAYCESVLDLRALLDGDKIPYIKSPKTWTSGLANITALLSGNIKAVSDPYGADYGGYLGFLYFLKSRKDRTYRAMDLQELFINSKPGYENVRMDALICNSSASMSYDYDLLFLDFINLINVDNNGIRVTKKQKYSYF